jgi:hypothetical protein
MKGSFTGLVPRASGRTLIGNQCAPTCLSKILGYVGNQWAL